MSLKESSTIKKLFRLLDEVNIHPRLLTIPILLSIIAAALEGAGMGLLIPLLNGFLQRNFSFLKDLPVVGDVLRFFPDWIVADDRMLFAALLVGFIGVYTLRNLFRFFSIISVGYFGERALHHLRKTLFIRYLSFGKLFFDTTNIGHHNTVLLEYAPYSLQPLLVVHQFINALFSLAISLVVMCVISWRLTLIALPLFVLLHFTVNSIVLTIRRHSRTISERGAELGKKSVEILSSIPLVKASRTELREQKLYTDISNKKGRLDFRVRSFQALMLPMQEIITMIAACGIFIGALYFLGREYIGSESALIVYFYVVLNASSKFGSLSNFRGTLAGADGPLDEVLKVFDEENKFPVLSGNTTFTGLKDAFEFRNFTFSYKDRDVLNDINVRIPKGRMTAVVGPTGSGKSTLINVLMRYYDCPPGTVFVDGADIRSFTLDSYLSHVALVSQETFLLHDTLRNNITYGLDDVPESAVLDAVKRARLTEAVAKMPQGLDTLIGDRGVKLSGGERQRVSIARVFLKKAEILILDEATSALDSKTEKQIQEAIDEAIQDRTAIVIAHRLSTIQHADTILVIKDGRLAEQGKLEELLARKGVFHGLWQEQKF